MLPAHSSHTSVGQWCSDTYTYSSSKTSLRPWRPLVGICPNIHYFWLSSSFSSCTSYGSATSPGLHRSFSPAAPAKRPCYATLRGVWGCFHVGLVGTIRYRPNIPYLLLQNLADRLRWSFSCLQLQRRAAQTALCKYTSQRVSIPRNIRLVDTHLRETKRTRKKCDNPRAGLGQAGRSGHCIAQPSILLMAPQCVQSTPRARSTTARLGAMTR